MDAKDKNEWRNPGDESEKSSSKGIRSDSDRRPDLSGITSSNAESSSDNNERIPGGTINTTNAGSGAMIGSTSGTSRDYERNPAFNRNREGDYYRDYGQRHESQSSSGNQGYQQASGGYNEGGYRNQDINYGNDRSQSQYRDQVYSGQNRDRDQYNRGQASASGSYSARSNSSYQQEQEGYRGGNRSYQQDYNEPDNRHRHYQGGGQERGYQGQHRAPNQYQGGQGGHSYGQAPDWNQSHGSNWANQERNRQNQQRDAQSGYGGYGQSLDFSRTGTTPTNSNRFEDQNRYSRDRYQNRNYEDTNRGRDYSNQSGRDYNSGADYGRESYNSQRNRDYGGGMRERYERQNYGPVNRGEGRERRGPGRSSGYNRERNRNYGAGTGSGSENYSGSSSYGGGGNYGAGYGPNRTGTPDYGSNRRESSRHQQDRHSYRDRDYRNEQDDRDRGFIDKVGDRVQSWFGGNENDRNR